MPSISSSTSCANSIYGLRLSYRPTGRKAIPLPGRTGCSVNKGWREARVDTLIRLSLQRTPLREAGETMLEPIVTETRNEGYKVDNFRDRVALDVEWNAKDGNLDRDIGAYRALYDAALIDVGVLNTRTMDLRDLGRQLALDAGMTIEQAKPILTTTTTTNREKLLPRMTRGDAGGCPMLAVFICAATHTPD